VSPFFRACLICFLDLIGKAIRRMEGMWNNLGGVGWPELAIGMARAGRRFSRSNDRKVATDGAAFLYVTLLSCPQQVRTL
jgi:hypothetical protein